MNLVVPFLPFYIRSLGVTNPDDLARWSGIVFAGPFLISFFTTPLWGSLGDRYGQKLMVVRAIFGLGISQLLIGLAQTVFQVFLFRMVQGAISGFVASAMTLVTVTTPTDRQGYALGLLASSSSAGTVLGPLFGGILADLIGYRELFFVVTALCFIGGIFVTLFLKDVPHDHRTKEQHTVIDNYRFVLHSPYLRTVLVTILLAQSAVLLVEPVFALFVESITTHTQYIATVAGIIFSIMGITMVFSAPWWGRRNDATGDRKKHLMISLGTSTVMYFLHTVIQSLLQLGFLRAILGFARGGVLPVLYSLTSIHTPQQRRGGVMGIITSFSVLGNMIGPLAGGMIASSYGLISCFYFTAALSLATVVFVYYFLPKDPPSEKAVAYH